MQGQESVSGLFAQYASYYVSHTQQFHNNICSKNEFRKGHEKSTYNTVVCGMDSLSVNSYLQVLGSNILILIVTHTHNTLFSFQLEYYPNPMSRCQFLSQIHLLRVSCWERASEISMDWWRIFLILYPLQQLQHKLTELAKWAGNDYPREILRLGCGVGLSQWWRIKCVSQNTRAFECSRFLSLQIRKIKVWGTTGALLKCPGQLAAAQMLFQSLRSKLQ